MIRINQFLFIRILYIVGILIFSFLINSCTSERSLYCISSKDCVTVLKRTNGEVDIVYGNYKSNKEPSENFITVKDVEFASLIVGLNQKLILDFDNRTKILNDVFKNNSIELYKNNKVLNDSLYTYFDGKYRRYREDVKYISFNIKENYVREKSLGKQKKE